MFSRDTVCSVEIRYVQLRYGMFSRDTVCSVEIRYVQ